MIGFLIFGIVLILASVGLWFAGLHSANRVFQIKRAETAHIKDLQDLAASVGADPAIGKGNFSQLAEVKGQVTCDQPLTSELAQAACVYYSYTVSREYEEKYWETDSKGNQVQRTRRGSETVASNTRMVPFYVQDDTGQIRVNSLDGASLDTIKSHSSFQPAGSNLQIGSLLLNLAGVGSNTLGYRYEEHILPVNHSLYILGEASDNGGELQMRKPSDKKAMFIVSPRSEEELIKSAQGAQTGFTIGSVVALIAGIGVIIYGVFKQ